MRSIFTDSSSPEANRSYTFDRLMFKIRATSGTRYSSRSSIALPRFLKCLSLADSLRPSIPGWRSLREARNKKRRVKWLIGAAANLIVTDVGWVEEAGKSPLKHTNVYIEMLHSQICAGVEPAASGGDSVGCAPSCRRLGQPGRRPNSLALA